MKCFKCDIACETTNNLLLHLKHVHSLQKKDLYKCTGDNCSRIYNSLNSFRKHLSTHYETNTAPLTKKEITKNLINPDAPVVKLQNYNVSLDDSGQSDVHIAEPTCSENISTYREDEINLKRSCVNYICIIG